jgi:acyl transferase domain-containing protein/NADP-dependent 3-hydroxy acid dehydrogenase YdfG
MPRSRDLAQFWGNLLRGVTCFETVPADRWDRTVFYDADPTTPDSSYSETGGFLPDIAFDPLDYGLPPSALASIDSAQLLALKVAAAALTDAGHPPGGDGHTRTSVILGIAGTTMKSLHPLAARLEVKRWRPLLQAQGLSPERIDALMAAAQAAYPDWTEDSFPGFLANVVAGRIAQRFDLGGITMALDAACASALVALGVAHTELNAGRADLVLTGGVDADNSAATFLSFTKTPALTAGQAVRPFDKGADGTLVSEGIGMLVLKPLAAAERDGNRIYALLKGVGTASDGRSKSIYAPRIEGQRLAMQRAYAASGVDPATVGLIEAHATGTRVGDEVELAGLDDFFRGAGAAPKSVVLGSAKALVGHAKAAAGAVGLIKAALALDQRVLPPSPAPADPVDLLADPASPFVSLAQAQPWLGAGPLRAGVSAFGFGGADAHAVLEQAPSPPIRDLLAPVPRGVLVSANSVAALRTQVASALDGLETREGDAVFAKLAIASESFVPEDGAPRLGFMAVDADEAAMALRHALAQLDRAGDVAWSLPSGIHYAPASASAGDVVAVFPGQGSQFPGMAADAAAAFPTLRAEIESMAQVLAADDCTELTARIWPGAAGDADGKKHQSVRLAETVYAQASLGAVSLGLWRVMQAAGLRARHALGHSFGELPALCAAGALTPQGFRALVAARGHALTIPAGAEAGTLLAVQASKAHLAGLDPSLSPEVQVANDNGPAQVVLGGSGSAIAATAEQLRAQGITVTELPVSAAFHTDLIAGRLGDWAATLATAAIEPPQFPVYTTADGEPYGPVLAEMRQTLTAQPRRAVQFADQVEAAWAAGGRIFVEIGPKSTLCGLISQCLDGRPHTTVALMPGQSGNSERQVREAVLKLRVLGLPLTEPGPVTAPPVPQNWTRTAIAVSGALIGEAQRTAHAEELKKAIACKAAQTTPTLAPERNNDSDVVPAAQTQIAPVAPPPEVSSEGDHERISAHAEFLALAREQTAMVKDLLATGDMARANQLLDQTGQIADLHKQWLDIDAGLSLHQPPVQHPLPVADAAPEHPVPVAVAAPPVDVQTQTPDAAVLNAWLTEIIAEQTGYPPDFLSPSMEIEADLGVDSIKLVEIIAALRSRLVAAVGPQFAAPDTLPREQLVRARSIADIADTLANFLNANTVSSDGAFPQQSPDQPSPVLARDPAALLIETVAELTGYPSDMLSLDLDIEADLGIDSIKRVEIFSRMRILLENPAEDRWPDRKQLASAQTLAAIIALFEDMGPTVASGALAPAADTQDQTAATAEPTIRLLRRVFEPCDLPDLTMTPEAPLLVIAQRSADASALLARLDARGQAYFLLALGGTHEVHPAVDYQMLDCSAPDRIDTAIARAESLTGPFAHVLFWLPEPGGRDAMVQALAVTSAMARYNDRTSALRSVLLARTIGPLELPAIAHDHGAGLSGLGRTMALEMAPVRIGVAHIAALSKNQTGPVDALFDALIAQADQVLWHADTGWQTVAYEPYGPLPAAVVDTGSADAPVIWVTGGLRGITATCALAVAERCAATAVVLIGRGAEPEPDWARGVPETQLQQAAVGKLGASVEVREIRAQVAAICSARAEAATLAVFQAAGIVAHPLHADVSDRTALEQAIATLPTGLQAPQVVIHGAGALADRRLADKRPTDFDVVWRPKVDGLAHMLALASPQTSAQAPPQTPAQIPPLRVLLFASTAGSFGNTGQSDYAAANEVLVDTATRLSALGTCKATAICWGPWSGGMVNAALEAQFRAQGIAAIDPAQGARLCADIATSDCGPVVIVDGGMLRPKPPSRVQFSQILEPVLQEHSLLGHVVLPAAWAAARLARLAGTTMIDGFEVGSGVRLGAGSTALECEVNGPQWRLMDNGKMAFAGTPSLSEVAQAERALIELASGASKLDISAYLNGPIGYGPSFSRVIAAWRTAPGEVVIDIAALPVLDVWPGVINPLLYDLATHAVLLHVWDRGGDSCLPRRTAQVTWHRAPDLSEPVRARATILSDTPEAITADIEVRKLRGDLLLELRGFMALRHRPADTRMAASGDAARAAVAAATAAEN